MGLIKEKDGHKLVKPFNSWDMNYHLYDDKGNDYLIDIEDIQDNESDLEEYGGMLWSEFSELESIEYVKEMAWKINKVDEESTQFWDILAAS